MAFHLEGPWLSTTGKKKGRQKFRSAEHAQKARQHKEDWKAMLKKYSIEQDDRKRNRALSSKETYQGSEPYRGQGSQPKSLPFTAAPCTKAAPKVYTGDAIVGIGTLHKSNAVPVFSKQDAIDISHMRR
jgi:hypothetical protein